MEIDIKPGKYVLAVSGGVDSMVLLDLLAKKPGVEVIAAHFDHGIRPEADKDEAFAARVAKMYGVEFVSASGRLGRNASEDSARKARYDFLTEVKKKYSAGSVITAHHQDDLIETAFLNILRGTGYKGLIAMQENKIVIRPLLNHSKAEILEYAEKNRLQWREDESNQDIRYTRNRVRQAVKGLSAEDREELISNINSISSLSAELESNTATLSQLVYKNQTVDRSNFAKLPAEVGNALILGWLKQLSVPDYDSRMVSRLNVFLRTAKPGSVQTVKGNLTVKTDAKTAQFSLSVK